MVNQKAVSIEANSENNPVTYGYHNSQVRLKHEIQGTESCLTSRSAQGEIMYGRETRDPVVKYYDQIFAVTSSNDIEWFVDGARSNGDCVLDLACGTGRISIPLAHAGLDVTAIDDSEGILQLFRNKLSAEPSPIQTRIRIQPARMQSFDLADRFYSIVCCDAFFHNLTVDEQISCLLCVAKHLVPRGIFAFNDIRRFCV
jgi:2-polyprenyl-3-methyl-5-hydroxy-6-metoxy-1,4-benzoquinol methylase